MKFQKPDKKNVFSQIFRNISDSNNGLKIMFRESSTVQRLISLEIVAGILLGVIFHFIGLEFIILAGIIIMIFTVETINTAIEEVNDLVTLEEDMRVKRSKDIASASVWIWHLVYIICAVGFIIMHILQFAWWTKIIPG